MNNVNDIQLDLDEYKNNSYLTHNIHPYPAKFIPQIPREIINNLTQKGDWILDPFCGSGTSLLEANLIGRNAIGIDINPLACLISKVKTRPLNAINIKNIKRVVSKIEKEKSSQKVFDKPNIVNIDHWFKEWVQREILIILHQINKLKKEEEKQFLLIALSSILVKVSNQDSDTRYVAVDKKLKEHDVFKHFTKRVDNMLSRIVQLDHIPSFGKSIVLNRDATNFGKLAKTVSLAITSPPYMNSYDYYLYHKHRLNWLGFNHKHTQEKEFGSRNKHNDKQLGIEFYLEPIKQNALEIKKVLKKDGCYVVIVGDSILNGNLIKMNAHFDRIFKEAGYVKIREIKFDQRKYTKSFTPKLKTVYKDTYVLIYQN